MRIRSFAASLCLSLIVLFLASASPAEQKSACVACHTFLGGDLAKPVLEWTGSIHQQNSITCDLCHGGNADIDVGNVQDLGGQFAAKMADAMSPARGFIGKPAGKKLFGVCSRCHYQSVARYEKSIMGRAYLEAKGGPSCVTCHHAHRNQMPEVPRVCESCHKDTTGFEQIDPMDVTESTVKTLSGIRITLAQQKAVGKKLPFLPEFPSELEAFQIGFIAFGAVAILFILGYLVYLALEKRR